MIKLVPITNIKSITSLKKICDLVFLFTKDTSAKATSLEEKKVLSQYAKKKPHKTFTTNKLSSVFFFFFSLLV